MRIRNLDDLITMARQLAEQEVSTFISEPEIVFRLNARIAQLYDMLVAADADRFVQEASLTTTSASGPPWTVELPADFYQIRGLDFVSGRSRYPLEPYTLQERNFDGGSSGWPFSDRSSIRYRVAGQGFVSDDVGDLVDLLHFDCNPGNSTLALYYVPAAPQLVDGEDVLNGVNGWEDWIVLKVAIDMMNKEESDPSALMAQCSEIEQRVKHLSTTRDSGRAPRVSDVRTSRSWLRAR